MAVRRASSTDFAGAIVRVDFTQDTARRLLTVVLFHVLLFVSFTHVGEKHFKKSSHRGVKKLGCCNRVFSHHSRLLTTFNFFELLDLFNALHEVLVRTRQSVVQKKRIRHIGGINGQVNCAHSFKIMQRHNLLLLLRSTKIGSFNLPSSNTEVVHQVTHFLRHFRRRGFAIIHTFDRCLKVLRGCGSKTLGFLSRYGSSILQPCLTTDVSSLKKIKHDVHKVGVRCKLGFVQQKQMLNPFIHG